LSEIRAFIAFDFSEEIYKTLDKITIDLKNQLSGLPVRWVPVYNIHLTIKFLGDITHSEFVNLKKLLFETSKNIPPIDISLFGSGVFPSYQRPRVIWIGLKSPPILEEFYNKLEEGSAVLGFEREKRKFSPHITIGRVARKADKREVLEIGGKLETIQLGLLGNDCLSQVHIYQSNLKPDGPVYNKLYTSNLSKENSIQI
jgi:2'-5' RNA ligase